jgi:dihydroorotase
VAIAHVSTAGAVTVLRAAKAAGVDVRAESCPHHLLLTADAAAGLGTLGKVNPPLRDEVDREALWQGIADGTIDQIGSDHAPHTDAERAADDPAQAPSGFAGVQNTLSLLWGVRGLGPTALVRLLCEAPARTWGLWPRKGSLAAGADADLAIVRPGPPRTAPRQWSRHPASPLLALCPARAEVVATVVGGRLAFTDGAPVGAPCGTWLRP